MLMEITNDFTSFQKRVLLSLDNLFEKAFKTGYDFLFIQTLFGAHPLSLTMTQEATSSIFETVHFVRYFDQLVSENNSQKNNLRIGLSIYCHIYETNFIPRIIHNLITIREGILDSFPFKLTNNKWEMSPDRKIKQIAEKDNVIGDLMKEFYEAEIRNAFVHSDYILTDESIILTADRNMKKLIFPKNDLANKLDNMHFFFEAFIQTWMAYKIEIYNNGDVIYGNSKIERYKLIVNAENHELIGLESTDEEPNGEYLKRRNCNKQ